MNPATCCKGSLLAAVHWQVPSCPTTCCEGWLAAMHAMGAGVMATLQQQLLQHGLLQVDTTLKGPFMASG